MAWPPDPIAADKANATVQEDDHAPHHNALAGAINDLVAFGPAPLTQDINAQTGTAYTLVLADAGKLVTLDNGAAITLTVPPNSSVAFPVGTRVDLAGIGVGIVTIAAGSGVTVNGTPSLVFEDRYSSASLVKLATDTWLAVGRFADA